jgi:hypothetical protein
MEYRDYPFIRRAKKRSRDEIYQEDHEANLGTKSDSGSESGSEFVRRGPMLERSHPPFPPIPSGPPPSPVSEAVPVIFEITITANNIQPYFLEDKYDPQEPPTDRPIILISPYHIRNTRIHIDTANGDTDFSTMDEALAHRPPTRCFRIRFIGLFYLMMGLVGFVILAIVIITAASAYQEVKTHA